MRPWTDIALEALVLGGLVAAAMVLAVAAVREAAKRVPALRDARPWIHHAVAGAIVGAGVHVAFELLGANEAWCAVAFPAS